MAKRNIINNYFILLAGCLLLWLAIPFTVRANDNEINVRDCGANGSDSMNDYSAIQAALNRARGSNGQATVVIPAGTYYLDNNSLRISSNTTLIADGATIIFRGGSRDIPMLVNDEDSQVSSASAGGYNHASNITVQGGTWDGNAKATAPANIFHFSHASNITITGATLKNCCGTHFIEFAGVKDSKITNCTFKDFIKKSGVSYKTSDPTASLKTNDAGEVSIVSEAVQLDFCEQKTSSGSPPFDGTVSKNIEVSGCTFINCLSGIGNHHHERSSSDWTFKDNTFTNISYSCFNIENTDNITISGNKATSAFCFVQMKDTNAKNIVISDNEVKNDKRSTYMGFKINDSKGVTIKNNKISGYNYGILAMGSDITVTGNTVTDCNLFGIRFTDGSNSSGGIKNNTVSDITEVGIGVLGFKGDIIGNTTTKFGFYGIRATGSSTGTIKDNIYDQSYSIYNTSQMTQGSNKYLKKGKFVAEPDYYTIYYHSSENAKASKKKTVVKYDDVVQALTIKELGFSGCGKRFSGWKAYRTDLRQWNVMDKSGKDSWTETLPSGYSYYLHKDGRYFKHAANKGAELHLYAVWESTGKEKHNWGKITYSWSKDYSKLTATRVCKSDSSHVETETVKATSKMKTKPTMSKAGKMVCKSKSFKNKAFSAQSVTVTLPKIKTSYKDSTGKYTIKKNMTAIYNGPAKNSAKTVTIPATIKVSGVTIKVVGIGSKAFNDCKKLKTITIKSTKLTDKNVDKNAFTGMPDTTIIKCPKSSVKKYKTLFIKKGVKEASSIQS